MSKHVELMTKRQDLCLQRRSRPEQSDQRQANQPANISHQPRASPDSTSLASRIEFPTMTGIEEIEKVHQEQLKSGSFQAEDPLPTTLSGCSSRRFEEQFEMVASPRNHRYRCSRCESRGSVLLCNHPNRLSGSLVVR